jgi:uncharacterized protein YcfL
MKRLLLIPALLLLGCGVRAPLAGRHDPYARLQVSFAEKSLENKTAVADPKTYRDRANILFVQVPIRADTDDRLWVSYQVTFFNAAGVQLSTTGWLNKVLTPRVQDEITANSLTAEAEDFRINIKWSKVSN